MAAPKKKPSKPTPTQKTIKEPVTKKHVSGGDFFDKINLWIEKRHTVIFWVSMGITALFSILLFNIRLDIGGDDASYIERAYNFIHKGQFPSFQGPLYPVFLSPFVAIFGINIFLLKFLSVLFTVAQVYFLWKALKKHSPALVTLAAIFLSATNYYILTFASLTYNEAFFMMLQAMLIWLVLDKLPENDKEVSIKHNWKFFLSLSILLVAMYLTRTVAVLSVAAVMGYLLLTRRWKSLAFALSGVILTLGAYTIIKNTVIKGESQYEQQGNTLLLKDPYKKELGNEDINGFFKRLTGNSKLYFSKRMMMILNFKEETNTKTNDFITIFIYALILLGIYRGFKTDHRFFFIGLYTFIFAVGTFIVLQTRWDQLRLILVLLLPLSLTIFYGLYSIAKKDSFRALQPVVAILFIILILVGFSKSFIYANKNFATLQKNLKGDHLYGYTDDWVNFAKMSKWVEKNVPDSSVVLCRKPSMAMLFANGRTFQGVYVVPSTDGDSCLTYLKDLKVSYVMDASLRRNPYKYTGQVITTIRSILYYTTQKHPTAFTLIHTEGQKEPAYLYKVNYPDSLQ